MDESWKIVFEGEIEERPVKIEISSDNDKRIITNQGYDDDDGKVEREEGSFTHFPPTYEDKEIHIEGTDLIDIENQLKNAKFSKTSISLILRKLS